MEVQNPQNKSVHNERFAITHEQAIDFQLRTAWLSLTRVYNGIAMQNGLSMAMAFILINISKKGSNPTKLAPKMGMQANSLSRTLKTLEDKGLIIRKKTANDRREVVIFLTEQGVEARKVANSIIANFNEKIYKQVNEEELKVIFATMEKIHGAIADMREEYGIDEMSPTDLD